ncbi:hypothetical protein TGAM01_v211062 [Trichoderma gamsii]|uniref:RING-type E3 ubiquitin transferase n=1 Tax=Trichoderma gamsii TaxID=398673 RepID=A0A2P4Z714_9HYPO|nr:hypothetical protein TGAM01_v211062 [Trichoderma gamsii]PON20081.1 hypothetical protein TGAM01_v211062 [Trichoderma gamsii]
MDSPDYSNGHLGAIMSDEVAYCHACSNGWHRAGHGLVCPNCSSEVMEITIPDSDPPGFSDGSPSTLPALHGQYHFHNGNDHDRNHGRDHDNEHNNGHDSDLDEAVIEEHMSPHGLNHHRSVRDRSGFPNHELDVDLIHNLSPPPPPHSAGGPDMLQQRRGSEEYRFGGPQVHRSTFMNGSGSASATIFSGPSSGFFPPGGSPPYDHLDELFQALTEGLDLIVTYAIEAHRRPNAAPPASVEALANLYRRPVDSSMWESGSKTECAICIDDMKMGDLAAFLPCKHWFHEACVVLWLKEHNTCPMCRASIEKDSDGNSGRTSNGNANTSGPSRSWPSQPDDQSGNGLNRSGPLPIPGPRPSQLSRPLSQSQSRLNEALRSISLRQEESQQQQECERESHVWSVSSPAERQRDESEQDSGEAHETLFPQQDLE